VCIGNSVELIKTIPDNYVDLIIADYPFRFKLEYHKVLAKEYYRVLKDTGNLIIINNPTNLFKTIPFYQDFIFRNEIILIKPYKYIPFNKKMFYFKHNCIIWLVKSKNYYFKDLGYTDVLDNVYYMVKGKNVGSLPEKLVEIIIECFSKPNDLVLDVFYGYGTVKRVCERLKRNYIGFEIDPNKVQNPSYKSTVAN